MVENEFSELIHFYIVFQVIINFWNFHKLAALGGQIAAAAAAATAAAAAATSQPQAFTKNFKNQYKNYENLENCKFSHIFNTGIH